jgi:hypothetical protein
MFSNGHAAMYADAQKSASRREDTPAQRLVPGATDTAFHANGRR